jgi:hypothetical protein
MKWSFKMARFAGIEALPLSSLGSRLFLWPSCAWFCMSSAMH